ncbi:MAG: phosphate signaling complex protein PhoU [Deltaproteobacteria bacterium]|nr:phosphate signaling complex protein PhoU [Deltaproteobacteria bacterium]
MDIQHTSQQFNQDLSQLKEKLLYMGGLAEEMIRDSIRALRKRDSGLAGEVIDRDPDCDRLEVEIDELAIRILALRQPAARDLRFLTTALKISTDIERIADEAVNIAERTLELNRESRLKPYIDIPRMAEMAQRMLKDALDAFVHHDTRLAYAVCGGDDAIDELNKQILRELLTYMIEDPASITRATNTIFVAKYLERIADHATNIAEMVVYMVEGKIIRHTDAT